MKTKIYISAILLTFTTAIFAQEKKPMDKMEKTEVRTVKVEKDGKMVEKKVKVTTSKKQPVMTKIDKNHHENSKRIETPTKVTKTIALDNDNDPFYDTKSKIVYYTSANQKYKFAQNENGFIVSINDGVEDTIFGNARMTSNNKYYLLNTDTYSGLGYFNNKGEFVVEYYDDNTNNMIIETFSESNF